MSNEREPHDQHAAQKTKPGLLDRCPAWVRTFLEAVDGPTLKLLVVLACAAFWIVVVYLVVA